MTNEEIDKLIEEKFNLIKHKEQEINNIYKDIDDLNTKKFTASIRLIIKVAPKFDYLKKFLAIDDINIDYDNINNHVRSSQEQKSFIDEIIKRINSNTKSNEIITVYTVNDYILNHLGRLVEEKFIPANLIQIVMYDDGEDMKNGKATSYNNSGYINNWCIGFLS